MSQQHVTPREPIAVVGVSALFPGSIGTRGFWHDVLRGKDLLGDVPASHWLLSDYYDPDPLARDKTYARRGAFLPDVEFDPMAWGVPPSNLPATDTSQLLALIVAQQVLEDASRGDLGRIDRDRTSVILGVTSAQELLGSMVSRLQRPVWTKALGEMGLEPAQVDEACERIASHYVEWQESSFPGLLGNVVAGRIANRLDLGGTNCVCDAACASTFSALAMAVNELHLGSSDLVLTGGVDTMNDIFMYVCFSKTPALSRTGDCRPFSAKADGTMLGEGLGMVALKRLSDAEAAGDPIYAVIRGVGSSSDGRAKSVYAPVPEGQAKALRRAYAAAGFDAGTVELVEAHGTGTLAGDAAEVAGLRLVFQDTERFRRGERQFCALGSVKSQIGHTKSAAGAAGLFKAVMALHHRVLPATIKVDAPSPKLDIEESPFHLATEVRPWIKRDDEPRRAGVSSFGFGGSNFHVALEAYAGEGRARKLRTAPTELVVVSADGREALASACKGLAAEVRALLAASRATPHENEANVLQLVARRSHASAAGAERAAVVAEGATELAARLEEAAALAAQPGHGTTPRGVVVGGGAPEGGVCFLFPGQGSQYVGMGAGLALTWDAARAVWDRAATLLPDLAIHELAFPRPSFADGAKDRALAELTRTEHAQPALGAASLATLALLRAVGLSPDASIGHSFGEVVALAASGVLGEDDALRVARERGARMAEAAATSPGSMCAALAEKAAVLEALGGAVDVVVANENGPRELVLSGATAEIERAEARLAERGIETRRLKVATAFHSPIVSGAVAPFSAFLEGIPFGAPTSVVLADGTAAPYPEDPSAARRALAEQLAGPVRFAEAVEAAWARGCRVFVEVGPGAVLTGLVGRVLEGRPHHAIATDRRGKDAVTSLHEALGRLWALGVPLQLGALLDEFAAPVDPRGVAAPKLAVKINGSNFGKIHPPNPPGTSPRAVQARPRAPQVVAAPTVAPAAADTMTRPAPSPAPPTSPLVPAPAAAAPPAASLSQLEPAPEVAGLGGDVHLAWVAAFQEAQRQTVEAHVAYQEAMSGAHQAFLRAQEAGFVGLAALLGGAPVAVASPPAGPRDSAGQGLRAPPARPALTPLPPTVAAAPPAPAAPEPPAPREAAPPPRAPAAPTVDLERAMLEVVALKTGYPVEMLGADMDLEADLGVDSIKRVEILAALRQRTPDLPQLDMAKLGALRTLAQIVAHVRDVMGASAPAAAPAAALAAPAASAAPTVDLERAMLEVVALKTGYPVEMLGADMDLEADLGVDSIKRVEILAALRQRTPDLPQLDMAKLGALRTLAQIVAHVRDVMGASAPAAAAPPPAQAAAPADLERTMLEVVAQKTGYPVEMLGLDMDLEADLGVDSIKRVEILAATRQRAPGMPQLDMAKLGSLRTLAQIVAHVREVMGAAPNGSGSNGSSTNGSSNGRKANGAPAPAKPAIGRWVTVEEEAPALGLALPGLLDAKRCVVTDDGGGVAAALVAALVGRGVRAELAAGEVPAGADGVVFLGALRAAADDARASVALHVDALRAARAVSGARAPVLVTVQDSGGDLGLRGAGSPWRAGLTGLVKTAAQEWPAAGCRAIDLERAGLAPEVLAERLAEELLSGGAELEVGLRADGRRVTLSSRATALADAAPPALDPGSVVVVSGGARGVTAACALALVRATRCKVLILARTALEEEPASLAGARTDADLKRTLLAEAVARGEKPAPAELGARVAAVLAAREVRANLDAIRAAGGEARYEVVDVGDGEAVRRALEGARRTFGPIAGVLHGAGVIADKLIAAKTDAAAERVLATKILGLAALLDATRADDLRLLVLFSSVAARAGNRGQSDYAMANEVLNKVACAEAAARPTCVVKSIGWGPWASGMVSPALRAELERAGVPLVTLEEGPRAMLGELGRAGEVDVVIGAEPRAEALAGGADGARRERTFEVVIGARTHAYVDDHRVKGHAVFPVVLAVEYLARAARALDPARPLASIDELAVLRGVRLSRFEGVGDRLFVRLREAGPDRLEAEIVSRSGPGGSEARHYTAKLTLGEPRSSGARVQLGARAPWVGPVYGDALFHGPRFQVIQGAPELSDDGISGELVGARAAGWAGSFLTDPALLDGGLQLVVTFAKRATGASSLPTGFRSLRWFGWQGAGPARCLVRSRSLSADHTTSDLVFLEGDRVVAELDGVEVHALPGTRAPATAAEA